MFQVTTGLSRSLKVCFMYLQASLGLCRPPSPMKASVGLLQESAGLLLVSSALLNVSSEVWSRYLHISVGCSMSLQAFYRSLQACSMSLQAFTRYIQVSAGCSMTMQACSRGLYRPLNIIRDKSQLSKQIEQFLNYYF